MHVEIFGIFLKKGSRLICFPFFIPYKVPSYTIGAYLTRRVGIFFNSL